MGSDSQIWESFQIPQIYYVSLPTELLSVFIRTTNKTIAYFTIGVWVGLRYVDLGDLLRGKKDRLRNISNLPLSYPSGIK